MHIKMWEFPRPLKRGTENCLFQVVLRQHMCAIIFGWKTDSKLTTHPRNWVNLAHNQLGYSRGFQPTVTDRLYDDFATSAPIPLQ